MSKLSFRSRQLDVNKPIYIYRHEDYSKISEFAHGSRSVAPIPSGMEKEEESEFHIQQAIQNQKVTVKGVVIPTPAVEAGDDYNSCYKGNFPLPKQLIHIQPFDLEEIHPEYDLDSEDEEWLKQRMEHQNLDISPSEFENIINQLERGSGQHMVTLGEAKLLMKDHPVYIDIVYDYWVKKRCRLGASLMPQVLTDKKGLPLNSNLSKNPSSNASDSMLSSNPYIAFRRRAEKMQTRKNRKNDEYSYEKMLKLRRELARAQELFEMVKNREKLKSELIKIRMEMYVARYELQDFSGDCLREIKARFTSLTTVSRSPVKSFSSNSYHFTSPFKDQYEWGHEVKKRTLSPHKRGDQTAASKIAANNFLLKRKRLWSPTSTTSIDSNLHNETLVSPGAAKAYNNNNNGTSHHPSLLQRSRRQAAPPPARYMDQGDSSSHYYKRFRTIDPDSYGSSYRHNSYVYYEDERKRTSANTGSRDRYGVVGKNHKRQRLDAQQNVRKAAPGGSHTRAVDALSHFSRLPRSPPPIMSRVKAMRQLKRIVDSTIKPSHPNGPTTTSSINAATRQQPPTSQATRSLLQANYPDGEFSFFPKKSCQYTMPLPLRPAWEILFYTDDPSSANYSYLTATQGLNDEKCNILASRQDQREESKQQILQHHTGLPPEFEIRGWQSLFELRIPHSFPEGDYDKPNSPTLANLPHKKLGIDSVWQRLRRGRGNRMFLDQKVFSKFQERDLIPCTASDQEPLFKTSIPVMSEAKRRFPSHKSLLQRIRERENRLKDPSNIPHKASLACVISHIRKRIPKYVNRRLMEGETGLNDTPEPFVPTFARLIGSSIYPLHKALSSSDSRTKIRISTHSIPGKNYPQKPHYTEQSNNVPLHNYNPANPSYPDGLVSSVSISMPFNNYYSAHALNANTNNNGNIRRENEGTPVTNYNDHGHYVLKHMFANAATTSFTVSHAISSTTANVGIRHNLGSSTTLTNVSTTTNFYHRPLPSTNIRGGEYVAINKKANNVAPSHQPLILTGNALSSVPNNITGSITFNGGGPIPPALQTNLISLINNNAAALNYHQQQQVYQHITNTGTLMSSSGGHVVAPNNPLSKPSLQHFLILKQPRSSLAGASTINTLANNYHNLTSFNLIKNRSEYALSDVSISQHHQQLNLSNRAPPSSIVLVNSGIASFASTTLNPLPTNTDNVLSLAGINSLQSQQLSNLLYRPSQISSASSGLTSMSNTILRLSGSDNMLCNYNNRISILTTMDKSLQGSNVIGHQNVMYVNNNQFLLSSTVGDLGSVSRANPASYTQQIQAMGLGKQQKPQHSFIRSITGMTNASGGSGTPNVFGIANNQGGEGIHNLLVSYPSCKPLNTLSLITTAFENGKSVFTLPSTLINSFNPPTTVPYSRVVVNPFPLLNLSSALKTGVVSKTRPYLVSNDGPVYTFSATVSLADNLRTLTTISNLQNTSFSNINLTNQQINVAPYRIIPHASTHSSLASATKITNNFSNFKIIATDASGGSYILINNPKGTSPEGQLKYITSMKGLDNLLDIGSLMDNSLTSTHPQINIQQSSASSVSSMGGGPGTILLLSPQQKRLTNQYKQHITHSSINNTDSHIISIPSNSYDTSQRTLNVSKDSNSHSLVNINGLLLPQNNQRFKTLSLLLPSGQLIQAPGSSISNNLSGSTNTFPESSLAPTILDSVQGKNLFLATKEKGVKYPLTKTFTTTDNHSLIQSHHLPSSILNGLLEQNTIQKSIGSEPLSKNSNLTLMSNSNSCLQPQPTTLGSPSQQQYLYHENKPFQTIQNQAFYSRLSEYTVANNTAIYDPSSTNKLTNKNLLTSLIFTNNMRLSGQQQTSHQSKPVPKYGGAVGQATPSHTNNNMQSHHGDGIALSNSSAPNILNAPDPLHHNTPRGELEKLIVGEQGNIGNSAMTFSSLVCGTKSAVELPTNVLSNATTSSPSFSPTIVNLFAIT